MFTINKVYVKVHSIFEVQSILLSVILRWVFFFDILSFEVQSFYVQSFDVRFFDVQSYVQFFYVQSFDVQSFGCGEAGGEPRTN
jgi:hypothetical protein